MKGFVPTPSGAVDLMVRKLFRGKAPSEGSSVLDPGCGNGEFIEGVIRFCRGHGWTIPRIVGVELDPGRAAVARQRFRDIEVVEIRHADFLVDSDERFDFIIGNPPYVSILSLSQEERAAYRAAYRTATGRFDLYLLFFEQALRVLAPAGRLVFITPEKFLYVETAGPLRQLLRGYRLEELEFTSETTFPDHTAYPLISTVVAARPTSRTRVVRRDGTSLQVSILESSHTWLPAIEGFSRAVSSLTLADVSRRISCGVATGADSVFVVRTADLSDELCPFAHPTVSGRQIAPSGALRSSSSILAPYDARGRLLPESHLGALGDFLREPDRQRQLKARTCVGRKSWYAFHDSFPLEDIRRPKLLCKDITESPFFIVDRSGDLVPRHSVYYIVPANPADIDALGEYVNSTEALEWLRAHCQRAANGFLRLQSHVLKQLPLSSRFRGSTVPPVRATQHELQLA
ncbi:MAG: HsdM family class I SAM-dependent methyltransferase [Gemmatimonadaceae bacterium]